MSFPNIPDVSPEIDICREDVINLLLASIAFEELGLSHIINAEAEKIQFVLGTLEHKKPWTPDAQIRPPHPPKPPTIEDLLAIDSSVEKTLRSVIKTEMLLQFKLEDIIDFSQLTTTTTTTTTTSTSTSTTSTTTTTTYDG